MSWLARLLQTREVPFQLLGNHRVITAKQLVELPWLRDLVKEFPNRFELHPQMDVYIYYPEGK